LVIKKKFIAMHGHMNLKFIIVFKQLATRI